MNTLFKRFEKKYVTYNRIEISRSAILHNVAAFEKLSNKAVIPVLKGNGYGHGIDLVAKILKTRNLPYIAVDGYFEALKIREVSSQPVLIMGAILPENYTRLTYSNFAFVVDSEASIKALAATKKRIKVHLECNSGMNRYGAMPQDMAKLTRLVLEYKNLTLEGVMSHLADSDGKDQATVDTAVTVFDACVAAVLEAGANPTIFHVAQTAGSLKAKSKYANTVRVGIGTYGINPFPADHPLHETLQNELRPALRLVSRVAKIIELEKGDKVSYNYTFTAPEKMKIGILPLGYYEGVNRALSNSGLVKINGNFTPIVGRICMNHSIVSLEQTATSLGDEVIVYSNDIYDVNAVDNIAKTHNLFNYNLLTALSPDVRRIIVE